MTQKKLLILTGSAVALLFIVILGFSVSFPASFFIQKTPYMSSSFTFLSGSSIYNYNGAAFYKTNVDGSNYTVLNNTVRLPAVKEMFWAGQKGAFLVFDTYQFDGSDMANVLAANGISQDQMPFTLWYLDFSSSTLSLVDKEEIVPNMGYFMAKTDTFYYLRNSDHEASGVQLVTYSLASKTSSSFVTDTVASNNIEALVPCDTSRVCVVERNQKTNFLSMWYVDNEVKSYHFKDEFEGFARTADPSVFMIAKKAKASSTGDEDSFVQATVYRFDSVSNTKVKLFDQNPWRQSMVANTDEKGYFVLSGEVDNNKLSYETTAKTLFGLTKSSQLEFQTEKSSHTPSFLAPYSFGDSGIMLGTDTDNSVWMISPNKQKVATITERSAVEASLSSCFKPTSSHEYSDALMQFKIGVTYDSSYGSVVKQFMKCASQKSSTMLGYSYEFVGTSPRDGRYVTN